MKNKIEDQTKNVMSTVFEIPIDSIDNNSSPDTIESWDSLKHMNLVTALEEEFNITFNDDEIFKMGSYSSIKHIIAEYSE